MRDDLTRILFSSMVLVINQRTDKMNEEQKQWIEALKTLLNADREDSAASYEKLVEDVQTHVDAAPEP